MIKINELYKRFQSSHEMQNVMKGGGGGGGGGGGDLIRKVVRVTCT